MKGKYINIYIFFKCWNIWYVTMYFFSRANETHDEAEKRRHSDCESHRNKFQALSPQSKANHREKDRKRKALQRQERKKCEKSLPKIKVAGKNQIPDGIQAIVEEPAPKILTYEDIRDRNIAERKKLLQDLKIDQLKAATAVRGIAKKE